jgi:hypothetical protein
MMSQVFYRCTTGVQPKKNKSFCQHCLLPYWTTDYFPLPQRFLQEILHYLFLSNQTPVCSDVTKDNPVNDTNMNLSLTYLSKIKNDMIFIKLEEKRENNQILA